MRIKTSPVFVLDKFVALRSQSYSFSYNGIQTSKQKRVQYASHFQGYVNCFLNSDTYLATNKSIRTNLHKLTVEKQIKLEYV